MAGTRLERLHRHRLVMEVAVAEGLSLDAARELLIERRRAASARAQESVRHAPIDRLGSAIVADEGRQPRFWWEKY